MKKKINIDKIIKVTSKIGNQRELSAIRDTFALILPLIITGAIGILGVTFFFGGWGATSTSILGWIAKAAGGIENKGSGNWQFTGSWIEVSKNGQKVFNVLNAATFDWFTIYTVLILGFVYSKILKSETPILASAVSLASFLILGGTNSSFFGANGLLPGIITSIVVIYLFTKLQKVEKLKINMPSGVPPAIGRAFSALLHIVVILLAVALFNYIFWVAGNYGNISLKDRNGNFMAKSSNMSFIAMFFKGVTSPFMSFIGSKSGGLGIMILYLLFVGFFWWCGIHGSNILNGIFYPIWFGLITQNAEAIKSLGSYQAAYDAGLLSIANWAFIEQFAMITGWGLTGMLVLAAFIWSKNPIWKKINAVATPAAVFNINEPVTYGYPIMLNPILAVPTILAGPIAGAIGYTATYFELMRIAHIYVPWPLPAPIGAILATGIDWRAIPVVLTIFAAVFLIYIPFILLDNKIQKNTGVAVATSLNEKIKAKFLKTKSKPKNEK